MIGHSPADAALRPKLYALGRTTPCERRGDGETVIVLAVDEGRGERIVSALAPHFLVVRPSVPWEVIVDAPGSAAWLDGVLDSLGWATLAVVATEPLAHAAEHANRAGRVGAEWFVVASARAAGARSTQRGVVSDVRIARIRSALASTGLSTRIDRSVARR